MKKKFATNIGQKKSLLTELLKNMLTKTPANGNIRDPKNPSYQMVRPGDQVSGTFSKTLLQGSQGHLTHPIQGVGMILNI